MIFADEPHNTPVCLFCGDKKVVMIPCPTPEVFGVNVSCTVAHYGPCPNCISATAQPATTRWGGTHEWLTKLINRK